jgi:hypothetical protein
MAHSEWRKKLPDMGAGKSEPPVRRGAYEFFRSLERFLDATVPGPAEMRKAVEEIVKTSKSGVSHRHMAFPEGAFLNCYLLPALHQFLSMHDGMDAATAREALLSESYRQMRRYASGTPARGSKHPFSKAVGISAPSIVRKWKGTNALSQSCPDLALRAPFPYHTVFEGKYFWRGSFAAAETALASDIYEAFFYRGLANLEATKIHPAWNYDYACVLAYDATQEGMLARAWNALRPKIGKGCWEGAGIYVMILRGRR